MTYTHKIQIHVYNSKSWFTDLVHKLQQSVSGEVTNIGGWWYDDDEHVTAASAIHKRRMNGSQNRDRKGQTTAKWRLVMMMNANTAKRSEKEWRRWVDEEKNWREKGWFDEENKWMGTKMMIWWREKKKVKRGGCESRK